MTAIEIDLAKRSDDAELRRILRETPTPGDISVSFQREPSFFDAATVEGPFHQTVVARRVDQTDSLIGLGTRSIRNRFVNRTSTPIGYLAGLRIEPAYRGKTFLARGYRFFKKLHTDQRCRFYLTTIAVGNQTAQNVLTKGRGPLPTYAPMGKFLTHAIPLPQTSNRKSIRSSERDHSTKVERAENNQVDEIVEFLSSVGRDKQFFPDYQRSDFFDEHSSFRNLCVTDLLVAREDSKIVGVLAVWDQRAYRQAVVEGYHGATRWLRRPYNMIAGIRGRPKLPAIGNPFDYLFAALPVVRDNDLTIFDRLLADACQLASSKLANRKGYFLLGLHERDGFNSVAQKYSRQVYETMLYGVYWQDGEDIWRMLDQRVPYLELGAL